VHPGSRHRPEDYPLAFVPDRGSAMRRCCAARLAAGVTFAIADCSVFVSGISARSKKSFSLAPGMRLRMARTWISWAKSVLGCRLDAIGIAGSILRTSSKPRHCFCFTRHREKQRELARWRPSMWARGSHDDRSVTSQREQMDAHELLCRGCPARPRKHSSLSQSLSASSSGSSLASLVPRQYLEQFNLTLLHEIHPSGQADAAFFI